MDQREDMADLISRITPESVFVAMGFTQSEPHGVEGYPTLLTRDWTPELTERTKDLGNALRIRASKSAVRIVGRPDFEGMSYDQHLNALRPYMTRLHMARDKFVRRAWRLCIAKGLDS